MLFIRCNSSREENLLAIVLRVFANSQTQFRRISSLTLCRCQTIQEDLSVALASDVRSSTERRDHSATGLIVWIHSPSIHEMNSRLDLILEERIATVSKKKHRG